MMLGWGKGGDGAKRGETDRIGGSGEALVNNCVLLMVKKS